jgi:uncharacterized membrane protein YqjE
METTGSLHQLAMNSKQFVRRLAIIGENRIELLTVEMQEEREHLVNAFLLALGVAAFGLLAGVTLTTAIAVWLWAYSPLGVLLALTVIYGGAGGLLYWRLTQLLRNWQTFPASLDQIRKDRAGLEKRLS